MPQTSKPFDPRQQFTEALSEADVMITQLRAALDRLAWLKERIAEEFAELERRSDQLQIFDEDQAAAILQVKPDHLGRLRRRHRLPHVNFGTCIRYTHRNLADICEILAAGVSSPHVSKGHLQHRQAA